MMRFADLFSTAGVHPDRLLGDASLEGMVADSRKASPGCLFVCMPSPSGDTHRFLDDARERGAVAALTHTDAGCERAWDLGMAAALVRHEGKTFAEALARLCKAFFGDPSGRLRLVGVTGTNGKTTTAWVMRDALEALGVPSAYLGTLGYKTGEGKLTLENTTPFAVELNQCLADAVASGIQGFVMEVSSHALEERRADGLEFDAAIFTNLTQDHLDYHGTMEAYEAAKWRLFSDLPATAGKPFRAAIDADDPVGARWLERIDHPAVSYGVQSGSLRGKPLRVTVESIQMELSFGERVVPVQVGLGGLFNVQNTLAVAAGLLALGYSLDDAATALRAAKPVPGRFEPVRNDLGIGVIVDYAHTPDALEKLLDAVRALEPRRVITVFGCGGDRDRTKRPKMARVVSERSDLSVVTSDNPRTEDPHRILGDVVAGLAQGSEAVTIVDRKEAIFEALRRAQPGDVVVIAGKGHEDYQIIGRTKFPMDDRKIAREALEALA
ncbi:MAG: UDP-N-acetylmuramoyl-L-alanyl-D-glutamate--2,6-diaminopimelate ligase [Fimbriimonadales bacterium]|nr:UDP-N-acetylmuramoyl-L-alanyl-D-glutamate--2,6-diaminopimelate ligase [Fimbriimonadales bacterium]